MIGKLDENISREIYSLTIRKLTPDIFLGVQRGIDVTFSFMTEEKEGILSNYRTIHFKGVHNSIWDTDKAKDKVIEYINSGGLLVSNPAYIKDKFLE